jgi:hypothetical protein
LLNPLVELTDSLRQCWTSADILYAMFTDSDLLYSLWCRPVIYGSTVLFRVCSLAVFSLWIPYLGPYIKGRIYESRVPLSPPDVRCLVQRDSGFYEKGLLEKVRCGMEQQICKNYHWFVNMCNKT